MLCARFKTPDIAAQFKEAFEAAVEKCGSTETSPQKPKSVSNAGYNIVCMNSFHLSSFCEFQIMVSVLNFIIMSNLIVNTCDLNNTYTTSQQHNHK